MFRIIAMHKQIVPVNIATFPAQVFPMMPLKSIIKLSMIKKSLIRSLKKFSPLPKYDTIVTNTSQ